MIGILLNNGDLSVTNGSVDIDLVDEQIVEIVMMSSPGDIKEVPLLGVDAIGLQGGTIDSAIVGKIKSQLKTQHIEAKKVKVEPDNISIDL